MAKKYYAVRRGRTTGIFESWSECQKSIKGFSNASYKSFLTLDEARSFMEENKEDAPFEDISDVPEGAAAAYVDGSYNIKTKVFGFGAVIFHNGKAHSAYKGFENPEMASMRNVAGEIYGSVYAMKYCIRNGIKKLWIFYDYEGIEKWCSGEWKASRKGTAAYRSFYDSVKDKIDVTFIKVKGHSGNKYNDMADALAKKASGVS